MNIAVVGGGFIGVEVAENLAKSDFQVSLIEAQEQIMMPFDFDMVQILHKEISEKGIKLILGDGINEIMKEKVKLNSGKNNKCRVRGDGNWCEP